MTATESRLPGDAADLLLAGYAAGTLPAALHALVAGHMELSGRNRRYVSDLEAEAAAHALGGDSHRLTRRDDILAAILASTSDPVATLPAQATALPRAIVEFAGRDLGDMRWKRLLPGVRECRLDGEDGVEASLIRIAAGRRMPVHAHDGSEFTLVLKGGFSDITGHYSRGDIAVADSDLEHRPVADPDEECLCFAVTDAPLRLTGPVGRIVQRLLG